MRNEDDKMTEKRAVEVVINKIEVADKSAFDFNTNKSDETLNEEPSQQSMVDDSSELDSEIILRPHNHQDRKMIASADIPSSERCTIPRIIPSYSDSNSSQNPESRSQKNDMNKNSMTLHVMAPIRNADTQSNGKFSTDSMSSRAMENADSRERSTIHPRNRLSPLVYPMLNGGQINQAYSICDSNEYSPRSPGTFSVLATPHPPDDPTPGVKKKRAFSDLLVKSLSILYAVFNVTVGLAVYIADIISDSPRIIAEIFSLTLVIQAALFIIYLTMDISIFLNRKLKYERLLEKNIPDDVELTKTPDGHYEVNITLPELTKLGKSIKHDYCFSKDRHSSNFFLKVGATDDLMDFYATGTQSCFIIFSLAFCIGHLIHSGLILGYQIVFLTADDNKFYNCASISTLILDFIYPFYSFLLLFFIYKYSNVIINKNVILARFGIMHCLSSSICFWVWTICREVLEAIASKKYDGNATFINKDWNQHSMNISVKRFTEICDYQDESMKVIYNDISPYLYPFSVEFSILVVGVLYLVWQNVAMCSAEEEDEAATSMLCKQALVSVADTPESNVVVHADCQASNKGLFGGIVVLVLTIVTCILFFIAIYMDDGAKADLGITATLCTSLAILSTMIIACILGYRQITKLDLNSAHHNLLDDVLLFICMPAFFLNGVFSLIAAIMYANIIGATNIVIEIIQVLIQTVFLLDGVRRSSNTRKLRKQKPGRELVTFLVISNIALWLMQTFEVKAHGIQDNRYKFYGKELWTILGHLCLPLMMFYRFHSAVCFGDIWKYAYERSGH